MAAGFVLNLKLNQVGRLAFYRANLKSGAVHDDF